jgi:hypothetical protein
MSYRLHADVMARHIFMLYACLCVCACVRVCYNRYEMFIYKYHSLVKTMKQFNNDNTQIHLLTKDH